MIQLLLPELRLEGIVEFLQLRAHEYLQWHSDFKRNKGKNNVHAERLMQVPLFCLIMNLGATLCNSWACFPPDQGRDDISTFGALGSGE